MSTMQRFDIDPSKLENVVKVSMRRTKDLDYVFVDFATGESKTFKFESIDDANEFIGKIRR